MNARHCMNQFCDGPEWWAIEDESKENFKECPSCGYPCELKSVAESELGVDMILDACWAWDNRNKHDNG